MRLRRYLESDSVSRQCAAALFLRSEGLSGASCLPLLLQRCKSVPADATGLSDMEVALVAYGARSLGTILREVGYSEDDEMHTEIKDWLTSTTACQIEQVAAFAIYGIADLGVVDESVLTTLESLVLSERRSVEPGGVSIRAIAFRVLAQLDRELAGRLVDTEACREFVAAVSVWRTQAASPEGLDQEIDWIQSRGL